MFPILSPTIKVSMSETSIQLARDLVLITCCN
jgi:hypothetical protein